MLEATLPIVVEQRAGEEDRWEWKSETDTVEFQYQLEPMPTHYGCSVDIINPADGELLDVMLLDPYPYDRGQRTTVRVIDILKRSDGDNKLLAVPIDRPWPAEATIQQARHDIWDWYTRHNKPITNWGGEEDAITAINACRGAAK